MWPGMVVRNCRSLDAIFAEAGSATSLLDLILAAALISGCLVYGSAWGDNNSVNIGGLADIDLVRATWRAPKDIAHLRTNIETLIGWHERNELVPFLVLVSSEHTIAKEIKSGPSLVVIPAQVVDTRIWIPLGNRGQRILIEHPSTGRMALMGPPPGMKLDLDFVAPAD